MRRRHVLQSLLAAPMLAAAAPQTATKDSLQVAATPAEAVAELPARFFTPSQFSALQKLSEVIMPAAEGRPGAAQAEAAEFLDFLISQSPADRQKQYRDGLDQLHAKGVTESTLAPLNAPWTYNGPKDAYARFLIAAKNDIMEATLNSRQWSTSSANRARAGTNYYWLPLE